MVRIRPIFGLCLLPNLQQLIANVDCLQAVVSVDKKKGLGSVAVSSILSNGKNLGTLSAPIY